MQGRIQDFFRRGCTRLLLYFNTKKPHSFFLQNTSCIRKLQVISGRGGAHPLHPPPRSAPEMSAINGPIQKTVYNKRIANKFRKEDEAVNHERKLIISVKLHV